MDLELSDEQTWLAESVETLLVREWRPAADAPYGEEAERDRLWRALVDFGALSVGGDDGLGAVELCLIARALGAHLAPVPYLASAAPSGPMAATASRCTAVACSRPTLRPLRTWPAGVGSIAVRGVALAQLDPGSSSASATASSPSASASTA